MRISSVFALLLRSYKHQLAETSGDYPKRVQTSFNGICD